MAESETAQRILFSFLATNSVASLFRALPRYPLDDAIENDLLLGPSDGGYDEDSLIARESLCLKDCKSCWAILKEGFVQRKKLLPQGPRKKRGRGAYDVEDTPLDQGSGTPAMVAGHAWPILHWLLSLFEKDELLRSQKSGGKAKLHGKIRNHHFFDVEKFSLLLLSQIPPPRGGSGPRWDAGAPVDIVFHAIRQQDGERREMAVRLLTLVRFCNISNGFGVLTRSFAAHQPHSLRLLQRTHVCGNIDDPLIYFFPPNHSKLDGEPAEDSPSSRF